MKAGGAFSKIVWRDIDIPANKAMEEYFVLKGDTFRVRPITRLPTAVTKDICRIPAGDLKLKTKNDLDHLRSVAEEKTQ